MITIGVLTPHAEAGPEVELPAMAPGQVATRVARVLAPGTDASAPGRPPTSPSGLRALAAPAVLDAAAAAFSDRVVDVIGYASTSTAYALGFDGEAAMVARLSERWRIPVTATSLAAIAALRALDVRRMTLVHPPWFGGETQELGAAYFRDQGFDVISSERADLDTDPRRVETSAVIEWISRNVSDEAEAVFIGGTGFRAAGAIETLEDRLGRPVLESNQVLLWSILATLAADVEVVGYGRLFRESPLPTT